MTNDELIQTAASALNPHTTAHDRLFGDVGAALISEKGNVYRGVCADTPNWGLCAERSAIAAMITGGEYTIQKIVAVWRNDKTGKLHVLPPCGVCREFMRNVDESNLETDVLVGRNETKKLKELIPLWEWPEALD